ncbi:hypothetical protein [Kitasatospora sp. NPDC057223]|uniref:hypothetical protein n=1 Tax=Kitasatospora sp. NPDC057223 TaxID=3346055 RepID=UPI00363832F6
MTYATPLNPAYTPFAEVARFRGVAFHVGANRHGYFLCLHLPDGPTLELGGDGVGGAAAQKPGGATGFTLRRALPDGQVNRIYDSTLLGPHHANGTNPAPLLAILDRFLPPPPPLPPSTPRTARQGLLRLT